MPETNGTQTKACCSACGHSEFRTAFSKTVLGRHNADYVRCVRCDTLQILQPHWLAEAYADGGVDLDTGAAQRGIIVSLYIRAMRQCRLVKPGGKIVDFGAGSGLLVRLLRDQGFDAAGYDRYIRPAFCREWHMEQWPAGGLNADLITAIEVFEHLTDPGETLASMAANLAGDGGVLIYTRLFDAAAHGSDWDYLSVEHGQHIVFYSRQGLSHLAESHGLRAVFLPLGFHLLVRPGCRISALRRLAVLAASASAFVTARLIGLCTSRHARIDNQVLARRTGGEAQRSS